MTCMEPCALAMQFITHLRKRNGESEFGKRTPRKANRCCRSLYAATSATRTHPPATPILTQ